MPFLCGARRKREAGFVARGRLEVSIDVANMAGRQGSGHHVTEDAAHSVSLGKARSAVRKRLRSRRASRRAGECRNGSAGAQRPVRPETKGRGPA